MTLSDTTALAERLDVLKSRVATALLAGTRKAEDVTLIAVSKGHSPEAIRELYRMGVKDFGESYAHEFEAKVAATKDLTDIQWHFIGHLQSNKAKRVAELRPLIHSVDRLSLVKELSKQADPAHPIRLLIQLQIDPHDSNKAGCPLEEAEHLCRAIIQTPGLEWDGFMGIGPADTEQEALRWLYEKFRTHSLMLWEKFSRRDPSRNVRPPKLSLGMSDDLEIALRCDSNMIRVGTALFGPRKT